MRLTRSARRSFSVGLAAILPVFGLEENGFSLPDPRADGNGISQPGDRFHEGRRLDREWPTKWVVRFPSSFSIFVFHLGDFNSTGEPKRN